MNVWKNAKLTPAGRAQAGADANPGMRHLFLLLADVSIIIAFLTHDSERDPVTTVPSLPRRIREHAATLLEGAPICPNALLHLGNRAAVDQALSRLARRGQLLRVCRGVYVRPIQTRFGIRAPAVGAVIAALAELWGETIVPCGGAAATVLGLTTQVPVRLVYLTSGPSRTLQLYAMTVQLRHSPRWQLVAPGRPAGLVVRALAWLGPGGVEQNLAAIQRGLSAADLAELAAARATLPSWIATPVSALVARG